MAEFSRITLTAIEAALSAGDLLRRGFGTSFTISTKAADVHNLVTEYDHRAEEAIIQFLKKEFPSSHFLAEESGASGIPSSSLLWIIDPLDGTVNFAHQIPCFSVSIAAQQDGQIVSGVVYQPITHELFIAERGSGAFLNGHRLNVSKTNNLKQAILATGFPYNLTENPLHCIEHFMEILRLGIPIRRFGSAAIDLCYTAAGRYDGYFEVSLAPWDCAAGFLLLQEAGGTITHWNNTPFDPFAYQSLLATNGLLHSALVEVLQRA